MQLATAQRPLRCVASGGLHSRNPGGQPKQVSIPHSPGEISTGYSASLPSLYAPWHVHTLANMLLRAPPAGRATPHDPPPPAASLAPPLLENVPPQLLRLPRAAAGPRVAAQVLWGQAEAASTWPAVGTGRICTVWSAAARCG